ncbi:hypothetical protein [Novosphingobium sp. PY1]|uniref:hypothetical protein n=1 Tax=Novosphingobium sp. PY1 TaxID=1882221 RepID=UPI001F5E1174|nr:hypothetical protein [Novosphingobium sp. PY1]
MADIKSESLAGFASENMAGFASETWPTSYRNVWPTSSEYAVRLVQTNFITPYVQLRVIRIPPAITLFAILAIGAIAGLYGLFFAAALLVVGFTLIRTLYVEEVLGDELGEKS